MLRQRVLTAGLLIPVVIACILILPVAWLAGVFALIVLAGAWEWSRLLPLHAISARSLFVLMVAGVLWLLWRARADAAGDIALWVLMAALVWWLLVPFWLNRPQVGAARSASATLVKMFAGIMTLVPAWLALIILRERPDQGAVLLLFVMVLVWLADSAAYFAGHRWGRRKLSPKVSPGKTWEGAMGALAMCAVFSLAGAWLLEWRGIDLWLFVLLGVITVMFSIIGDLFESLCKRHSGLKDSGGLIPGHGGVLDRIDSLTAAAPVFALGLHWISG